MEEDKTYYLLFLGYRGIPQQLSAVARIQEKPKLFSVIIRIWSKTQIIFCLHLKCKEKFKLSPALLNKGVQ
jgi:hypothetical protein